MSDEEIKKYCRDILNWKCDPDKREVALIKLGIYMAVSRMLIFLTTIKPESVPAF